MTVSYLNLSQYWQTLQTQMSLNHCETRCVCWCCYYSYTCLITVGYCGRTVHLSWHLSGTRNLTVDRSLAVLQACGPCDQTKQAFSETHTHKIPLLGQSSTTAYRCLQAIRHLQRGSCGGYFRTFCTVGMAELTQAWILLEKGQVSYIWSAFIHLVF